MAPIPGLPAGSDGTNATLLNGNDVLSFSGELSATVNSTGDPVVTSTASAAQFADGGTTPTPTVSTTTPGSSTSFDTSVSAASSTPSAASSTSSFQSSPSPAAIQNSSPPASSSSQSNNVQQASLAASSPGPITPAVDAGSSPAAVSAPTQQGGASSPSPSGSVGSVDRTSLFTSGVVSSYSFAARSSGSRPSLSSTPANKLKQGSPSITVISTPTVIDNIFTTIPVTSTITPSSTQAISLTGTFQPINNTSSSSKAASVNGAAIAGGVVGGILVGCALVFVWFFFRRRSKLRLEKDALNMAVVTPCTTMLSQATSLFSWMRPRTEAVHDRGRDPHVDPFRDEMRVVDRSESTHEVPIENPSTLYDLPPSLIPGGGMHRNSYATQRRAL